MNNVRQIFQEYELECSSLLTKYVSKAKAAFPNIHQRVMDASALFQVNQYGYCVADRYEEILGELEKDELSPIVRDIVKEKLSSEYDKVCHIQSQVAETLLYSEPGKVTVDEMLKDYTAIESITRPVISWTWSNLHNDTLKRCLERLQEIHKKHASLFMTTQKELEESIEDFDNAFLTMSSDDIGKFNEILTTHAESNQQLYQQQREVQSKVTPNLQLRKDPSMSLHVSSNDDALYV